MVNFLTIKRTVTIPFMSGEKQILALAEIGGSLFSKDFTYQLFFEYGFDGVSDHIRKEFMKRGGTKADFEKMIAEFHVTIGDRLGVNGKPKAKAKRTGKAIRVGKGNR